PAYYAGTDRRRHRLLRPGQPPVLHDGPGPHATRHCYPTGDHTPDVLQVPRNGGAFLEGHAARKDWVPRRSLPRRWWRPLRLWSSGVWTRISDPNRRADSLGDHDPESGLSSQ